MNFEKEVIMKVLVDFRQLLNSTLFIKKKADYLVRFL